MPEMPFLHQVDDQLELVQALVVGVLRLIAGLHCSLVAGLDQLGEAAAQDGLFAEQVGLGFFPGRWSPGPRREGADALGIGQRVSLGVPVAS